DAVACLSDCHVELLCARHPKTDRTRCHVTGLGVEVEEYFPGDEYIPHEGDEGNCYPDIKKWQDDEKVPGRLLYANDPQRGLGHVLDIFDRVRAAAAEATLHLAYDWRSAVNAVRWHASAMAETLLECERRVAVTAGVVDLGPVGRDELIREQLAAQ